MDSESLKSLGWLLLWGAVFFAMIRDRGVRVPERRGVRGELQPAAALRNRDI